MVGTSNQSVSEMAIDYTYSMVFHVVPNFLTTYCCFILVKSCTVDLPISSMVLFHILGLFQRIWRLFQQEIHLREHVSSCFGSCFMMQIHAKSMTYSQKKWWPFSIAMFDDTRGRPWNGRWWSVESGLGPTTSPGTFSVDLTELCQGFRAAERANMDDLRPESIYVAWWQWLHRIMIYRHIIYIYI